MAQFYRDWTEYSLGAGVGSGIADITPFLVATTYTTEVIETPLSASGRGLYNNRSGYTNVAIWRLDFAGSSIDEGEVFVQYYAETDHREAMNLSAVGMLRDSPQIQAYGGGSRAAGGGSNVRDYLESYADTGFAALGQTDPWEYADHQRVRNTLLRWRDTGSTVELKVKCWWADETEPSVWTLETSDATYAGQPGYAGFSRTSNSNRAQVITFIGVGTGGDAAPRSAGGGDPDEITGSLSATLDNATLSSTGELLISGSLSATLADATSSASGAAPITGALSAILDDATLTATGAGEVEGFGSLSVTLDGVSLSATGALDIVGQVSVTLANVSLAASGELLIQGEASPALDDVTLSAAGELITGESGRLNVVLDDVTLSAVGVLSAEGSANIQLDAATLVAQGQLLIQGAASIALDDVTLSTDPGSAPLPNRYYGVIPGGGMVVDVLEDGTTTGRAIELRVNDSVYGDRLAVIVGVKGIIDYLNTKETRPIA